MHRLSHSLPFLAALVLLTTDYATAKPRTRTITVDATFYGHVSDPSGKTATGRRFSLPGLSVDPRVIPYGSRVWVPGYGVRVADDCGRLIKNKRIDIRMPLASRSQLRRLGRQQMVIRFTPPQKPAKKQSK